MFPCASISHNVRQFVEIALEQTFIEKARKQKLLCLHCPQARREYGWMMYIRIPL